MNIFAIADTHLSGNPPSKPMYIFGEHWAGHWEKIKTDWLARVKPEDTVLLAGDISWAMKLEDALEDLEEIMSLPGNKIMIRGNHDYWWQTLTKMNKAVQGKLTFIQNNFTTSGDWAICGSRGWLCPEDPSFGDDDLPIYQREVERVKMSLEAAHKAGFTRKLLMLHYPPLYHQSQSSDFTRLFSDYQVELCIYGHLHSEAINYAPTGMINGTMCVLVSCDALDFKLKQLT